MPIFSVKKAGSLGNSGDAASFKKQRQKAKVKKFRRNCYNAITPNKQAAFNASYNFYKTLPKPSTFKLVVLRSSIVATLLSTVCTSVAVLIVRQEEVIGSRGDKALIINSNKLTSNKEESKANIEDKKEEEAINNKKDNLVLTSSCCPTVVLPVLLTPVAPSTPTSSSLKKR
jgi:hypothetical protein